MKQQALQVLKGLHGIVRDDKTISRLLPQLGELGLPYAQQAGNVAAALGYGRKKAPARKRAPAKRRGRGVAPSKKAELYSAAGKLEHQLGQAVGNALASAGPAQAAQAMDLLNLNGAFSEPSRVPQQRTNRRVTPIRSGLGRAPAKKRGKGFGNFLKGLIQAPLAGVAALSGGLHGAVGGFGRKPRARRAKKPTHIMLKL